MTAEIKIDKNVFKIDSNEIINIISVQSNLYKDQEVLNLKTVIEEYALERAYDIVLYFSKYDDFEELHSDLRGAVIEVVLNLLYTRNPVSNVVFLDHLSSQAYVNEEAHRGIS